MSVVILGGGDQRVEKECVVECKVGVCLVWSVGEVWWGTVGLLRNRSV